MMSDEIVIHKKLSIPIFEYSRVNDIEFVRIFGFLVYKKLGVKRQLFWLAWSYEKNG